MSRFSKVQDTILDSTLWEAPPEARLVYLGMLFASDLDGKLMTRTDTALARRINLPMEYLQAGLAELTAPDPQSANPDYEGRRVVRIEGGWLVVSKPRYMMEQTSQQALWAEKKARWRERKAAEEKALEARRKGSPDGHRAHSSMASDGPGKRTLAYEAQLAAHAPVMTSNKAILR